MVRTDMDGVVCNYPNQSTWTFGNLRISSEFCSGNIAAVEALDDANTQFELRTGPDCMGMPCETNYRTWFYFSISGAKKDQMVTLTVMNLNPQTKMFNQGMKPSYRVGEGGKWERLPQEVSYWSGEGRQFSVRFKFKFSNNDTPIFFAFTPPYSFEDCIKKVDNLEQQFSPTAGYRRQRPDSVYFEREVLTRSLDGRRVELITVSDMHGISDIREEPREGLFPGQTPDQRPYKFLDKTYYFLTARVHPGEAPAQWMWDGFLDFLFLKDDPRAKMLRRLFVFKIIPIINPDGVARGHYRADTQGLNLNRFYNSPDPKKHPTIWAVKEAVVHCNEKLKIKYFVDLHAHATKRGCFCYANALSNYSEQIENMLYPRLVALNCQHFDFSVCIFSEKAMESKDKNGQSKEGSSRVGIYRATGLIHSITVECNYNCGRVVNFKPPAVTDDGRCSPSETWRGPLPKFNTGIFRDVGKALGIAALDMEDSNPWSRVAGGANHKSLVDFREWLRSRLIAIEPYKAQLLEERKEREKLEAENKKAKKAAKDANPGPAGKGPAGKGGKVIPKGGSGSSLVPKKGAPGPARKAPIQVPCVVIARTESDKGKRMQADDSSDGDNDDDSDGAVEESVGTGNGSDDRAIADLERKAAEMAIAARLRKDNHTSSVGDISHHRASQEDGPPSGRRNNFGTRLTSEIMKHREIAAILGDDDSSEPSNNSGKANESKTSGIAAKRAQRPPVAGDPNQRQGPPSKIPQPGWARQALLAAQQRRASGGVLGIGGEGANSSDSTSEASDKPMARMPASSNGDHTLVSDLKQAMSSVSFGSSFPTVKENQPARMRNSSARQENDSMATEAEQQAINLQTLLAQAGATARIRGPAGSQIRKTGIPQQMNHTGRGLPMQGSVLHRRGSEGKGLSGQVNSQTQVSRSELAIGQLGSQQRAIPPKKQRA